MALLRNTISTIYKNRILLYINNNIHNFMIKNDRNILDFFLFLMYISITHVVVYSFWKTTTFNKIKLFPIRHTSRLTQHGETLQHIFDINKKVCVIGSTKSLYLKCHQTFGHSYANSFVMPCFALGRSLFLLRITTGTTRTGCTSAVVSDTTNHDSQQCMSE